MKAYKIELLVIDFDGLGKDSIIRECQLSKRLSFTNSKVCG